jgi:eukaryotic-like serine/threonine-protein kinase
VRGDLDAISVKAMEKDRARRYASVSELAADIQRHLENEPVVARPLSGIHRLRKTLGKHKALVRTLAAVFAILLLATFVSTLMYLRAQRARSDTQRQVVKLAVANGNRLAEEGDPAVALLWFARALPLAEGRDLEMLRIRIASALENTPKIALLLPHDAPLLRAQYVSGEREILTVAEDAARLWDAATGEIRRIFGGHSTPLVAASLNAATGRLFTADRAGTLQLWDTQTGVKIGAGLSHGGELKFADFNPAGTLMVTTGPNGVRLWDVTTGRLARVLAHPKGAHHAAFSPDGGLLASAGLTGYEFGIPRRGSSRLISRDSCMTSTVLRSAHAAGSSYRAHREPCLTRTPRDSS